MKAKFLILTCLIHSLNSDLTLASQEFYPAHENWVYLGAEYGFQKKSNVEDPEVENEGEELGLKLVYSHYWDQFVADIGVGYRQDEMNKDVTVETKAFFIELDAAYRITPKWSIGPILHLLMGQDVSFSDVGTNSDDKPTSTFLGGKLFYHFFNDSESYSLRGGIQNLVDIDIFERRISYTQAVIEIGIPLGSKRSTPPVVKKTKPKPKKKIKLELNKIGVNFETGKSTLKPRAKIVVAKMGKIFKKYSDQWNKLIIDGHTDSTGSRQLNLKLSKARALSVKNVLVEQGVIASKVETNGFGPDRPIDNRRIPEAYSKNRRVELEIKSSNASNEFIKRLNSVSNF